MFEWTVYLPVSGVESNALVLMLIGFTVGVIGGFFGIGGAFIVTPALNVLGFPMAFAIGTDMAHIAGKSIVATVKHGKFGNIDMRLGLLMILGTIIGIELGATLIMWLERMSSIGHVVRITYIVILFGMGVFMFYEYIKLTKFHTGKTAKDPAISRLALKMQSIKIPPMVNLRVSGLSVSFWVIMAVSIFTGFIAGFLGVGGGFIRMPAMIYILGCPTIVAVGTDLFEIMFSGAYGAFTYALKGRVELLAAVIMLFGAAIGAQIGAAATKYVRGIIIRLYFAITMIFAGISVIFKHLAAKNKEIYMPQLSGWAEAASIYLMLGSASVLSSIIIFFLVRGILRERARERASENLSWQKN